MTRRLRLTFVCETLQPPWDEGLKKTAFNLLAHLTPRLEAVQVCARPQSEVSAWAAQGAPGEMAGWLPLPPNKFLWSRSFAQAVRRFAPDAVLYIPASAGTGGAFVRASLLKLAAGGAPLGLVSLQPRRHRSLPHRLFFTRWIDRVFAPSVESQGAFSDLGYTCQRLAGGVDTQLFAPAAPAQRQQLRRQYGFSPDEKIVLHVGHLRPGRNLESLAGLVEAGFTVLVAASRLAYDAPLKRSLQQAGICLLDAYVPAIQQVYQLADCYVFPVQDPGSAIEVPLSVLEALACNLPVVTTPFGGLPHLLPPGDGLYYYNQPDQLTGLVGQAIDQQAECRTASMATPFSWPALADQILAGFPVPKGDRA